MTQKLCSKKLRLTLLGAALLVGSLSPHAARADDPNLTGQVQSLTDAIKAEGPQFLIAGKIERGQRERYAVNGEDFKTDEDTQVYGGDLAVGVDAEVSGAMLDGAEKLAKKVVLHPSSDRFTPSRTPLGTDSAVQAPGPLGTD